MDAAACALAPRASFLRRAGIWALRPWRGGGRLVRLLLVLTGLTSTFGVGATGLLGLHRVASSAICFSNPLDRTSLWPYNAATGSLTLRYYIRRGPSSSFRRSYISSTVSSFESWSHAWPVLHFERLAHPGKAEIVVQYGWYGEKGFWRDHAGLTLPDVDVFGCNLSHALIQINNSYLIRAGGLLYPVPMLDHLLVHEIGHALGLKHVYRRVASVMIPTAAAYRYTLPQPYDIHTISGLYPREFPRRVPTGIAAGRPERASGSVLLHGLPRLGAAVVPSH